MCGALAKRGVVSMEIKGKISGTSALEGALFDVAKKMYHACLVG
jgi:hypothetical protein